MKGFRNIALLKEVEGPENPGSLEKRVALAPPEVRKLVEDGRNVFVQKGAGEGVGFDDSDYENAGAIIQNEDKIYGGKDLLIKFKGLALDSINKIDRGATIFCMAHNASFPERAQLLTQNQINIIAMEHIVETPKHMSDEIVLSKTAMRRCLHAIGIPLTDLEIHIIGYSSRLIGAIRRAGNRNPKFLKIWPPDVTLQELEPLKKNSIIFFDSYWSNAKHHKPKIISELQSTESSACLFDLRKYEEEHGIASIQRYRETHPPYEFGMRRIQALHETGRAGAKYGLELLLKHGRGVNPEEANVLVLGYGNTGAGAIDECLIQGVRNLTVLGRRHTAKGTIEAFLETADLVVNGAEQPSELRGKNFLITDEHTAHSLKSGSVVIDLIGGSPSNRSPVENIVECTYMTDPYFEHNGVLFSALWGWPMMGFMRESASKYSTQILDVLLGYERLIDGLDNLHSAIKPAVHHLPCFAYKYDD